MPATSNSRAGLLYSKVMSPRRWVVLLSAAVMLAAAPAKAWCDAACMAADMSRQDAGEHAHCMPTSKGPGPSMAAVDLADCPSQDTARPASWAREFSRESFAAAASAPVAPLVRVAPTLAPQAPYALEALLVPGATPVPIAPLSASSVLRI